VALPDEPAFITKGTVRHPPSGKVGISREAGNVCFSRSGLAQFLIDAARSAFPEAITFHFQAACSGEF
jgi:hypothetical protein